MHKKLSADVAVIGGGVTGLFLTRMLAERGARVALIERGKELAGGPSTRNEGWLHSGAYHAAAILDRRIAVQVARRVKFGYEHVKGFAPETLEEPESKTFALVDEEKRDEVISRWDEAEVSYESVERKDFGNLAPQVNTDGIAGIYEVPDLSINVRVLYKKLASRALELGSTIFTNTAIESIQNAETLRLNGPDGTFYLECKLYVYAAGYGIKGLFKSLFDTDLPVRCWVSHLLDLPRVSKHGVFCLNPGQATVMHHGRWSIVGTNADQIKASSPPSGPDAKIVDSIKDNLHRLIRDLKLEDSHGRACVKVDMDPGKQAVSDVLGFAPPQLNFSCGEPRPNHIWVLPGKMTEAPFLADFLTSYFFQQQRLGDLGPASQSSSSTSSVLTPSSPAVAQRPKETVRRLATELQARGLKVWLDEWQLIPGRAWQEAIERIILSTKCAAVLVGKDGLGPWEEPEMRACLSQFVERKMPVIPVLLPGSSETPRLPLFLKEITWVDLRRDYDDGLRQLIWGITGQRDLEQLPPPVSTSRPLVYAEKMVITNEHLIGRKAELERLDRAWNSPDSARIHIISIVAWAGVGKSALVNHWFGQMASRSFFGAKRVFYWSFYSLGGSDEKAASVDEFVEKALVFFGDGTPAKGSLWDRTQRLVAHLRSARTLLILDGLEPLQHLPGPMAEILKDPSMQFLVRELAADNPGLCVITTRSAVHEIDALADSTAPRINLGDLPPADGAKLLKKYGVKGSKRDLRQASVEFQGHALTLTLLATFLRDWCNGDIHRRHEVELLEADEEHGRHAKSIMASYVKGFGEGPEIAVMKLVGLFDRRVDAAAIRVFREGPIIDGLTNALFRDDSGTLIPMDKSSWLHVLQRLRQAHLLLAADPKVPEALDAHPLVREYFRAYLKEKFPEGWKSGNARLYEHFKDASPKQPASRTEIESLYSSMIHACRAGLYKEALEIYWLRIHQGSKGHSHRILGLYEAELAMLSEFFESNSNWGDPLRQLNDRTQATVLGLAGSRLRALGRLAQAVDPLKKSLQVHEHLGDYLLAAVRARHLSEVHMTLGNLEQALKYTHEELRLTDESEKLMPSDPTGQATTATENENNIVYEKVVQLTIRGTILHQQGNWPEAQKLFATAEEMQQNAWPKLPVLFSLWGFRYCDLLLDQLEYAPNKEFRQQLQKLQKRLADMRELPSDVLVRTVPETNLALVGKELEDLFLAKFTLIRSRRADEKNSIKTQAEVRQAIDNLRIASRPEYIPLGLLTRAALHCEMGDLKTAERELKDALEIVKGGNMKLYEIDCYLHFVRLHLQQFQHSREEQYLEKASEYRDAAYSKIEQLGYHRRTRELDSLKASFPSK